MPLDHHQFAENRGRILLRQIAFAVALLFVGPVTIACAQSIFATKEPKTWFIGSLLFGFNSQHQLFALWIVARSRDGKVAS